MILVLSQRDIKHPASGGAEHYTHNALKELARTREVVHLAVDHPSIAVREETIDNIRYIRKGTNLINLIWHGYRYFKEHEKDVELLIDHANTHQFLTFLYARKKRVFFTHQLTQEIWSYFFGNVLGKPLHLAEELLLKLSRGRAITVSKSTYNDLHARGFHNLHICPEGNTPHNLTLPTTPKSDYLVYSGRLVPYKRVEDAINLAHAVGRDLYVIGSGPADYVNKLKLLASSLEYTEHVHFMGHLPREKKNEYVERAYLSIMPSIREGWGLVITESANFGTPSIVYDVPGTAEAVDYGSAGFVAPKTSWQGLLEAYRQITPEEYDRVRQAAFDFSLTLSWERTGEVFANIVEKMLKERT